MPTVAGNAVGPAVAVVNNAPCNAVVVLKEVDVVMPGASLRRGFSRDMRVRQHSHSIWPCELHLYNVTVAVVLPDGSHRLVFRQLVDFDKHDVLVIRVPPFAHWRPSVQGDSDCSSCSVTPIIEETSALTSGIVAIDTAPLCDAAPTGGSRCTGDSVLSAVASSSKASRTVLQTPSFVHVASDLSCSWAANVSAGLSIDTAVSSGVAGVAVCTAKIASVLPVSEASLSDCFGIDRPLASHLLADDAKGPQSQLVLLRPPAGDISVAVEAHPTTTIAAVAAQSSISFDFLIWLWLPGWRR